jgi:hypothetical protein
LVDVRKKTHHGAGVGCRNIINNSPPDVEVLASTTGAVHATLVTFSCAGIDVVRREEDKAHVLRKKENSEQR